MGELGRADTMSKAVVAAVLRASAMVDDRSPTIEEVYSTYDGMTKAAPLPQFTEITFRDELGEWIDTGILKETPEGVTLGLEQSLTREALTYGTVEQFDTLLNPES